MSVKMKTTKTKRPRPSVKGVRCRVRCDDQAWIDVWTSVAPPTAQIPSALRRLPTGRGRGGRRPVPRPTAAAPRTTARDPLSLSVDELDLSVAAGNWLSRSGIATIGELTRMTKDDLRRIRWSRARLIRCIVEALSEFGLALAVDIQRSGG